MRKILLFLWLCTVSTYSQTKSEGNWSVLSKENKVNFEIDFSQALIMGLDEQDFAEYEEDWEKDKPELLKNITLNANERLAGKIYLKQGADTPFTVILIINSISKNGDFKCTAVLKDSTGERKAIITGLEGRGGRFGSKLNLIKDGSNRIGTSLGNTIRRKLK